MKPTAERVAWWILIAVVALFAMHGITYEAYKAGYRDGIQFAIDRVNLQIEQVDRANTPR